MHQWWKLQLWLLCEEKSCRKSICTKMQNLAQITRFFVINMSQVGCKTSWDIWSGPEIPFCKKGHQYRYPPPPLWKVLSVWTGFCKIYSRTLHFTIIGAPKNIKYRIWRVWTQSSARQIWSNRVSMKRSWKMQFRCIDLVPIGPRIQKLWPTFIFGWFMITM